MVQRGVKILKVVWRADVHDVGARRHAMDGLDIERFFAIPALRILPQTGFWMPVRTRRHYLRELTPVHRRQSAVGRPLVGISQNGRRGVGVDDRDRLTRAILART